MMKRKKPKLSWVQRMELRETGSTMVWIAPHVIPETDEVTWGHWERYHG